MEHEIYVSREAANLGHNESAGYIKKAVNMALDAEGVDVPCIVSVMLTDDDGIHAVNKEFRNVDRATDVLSFPQNELEPGHFDAQMCERDPETAARLRARSSATAIKESSCTSRYTRSSTCWATTMWTRAE